jgi:Tfp pilus assembly PilM family ATPase
LFRPKAIRTGIDLGTVAVKLVCGRGAAKLEKITHVGVEAWDLDDHPDSTERAAKALRRLLHRLALSKGRLGRIAVAVGGQDASVREVVMPPISERELRRALPFEAKKHLDIEGMTAPILDAQIVGAAPPTEAGGPAQTRVVLAAAARPQRDFVLNVLARSGLVPEVVDAEPLASLNELVAEVPAAERGEVPFGLLDLGGRHAGLYITSTQGGLLARSLGSGPPDGDAPARDTYLRGLIVQIQETLTYYRGRSRRDVASLHLCGGGSLLPGFIPKLQHALGMPVSVLNPLRGLTSFARGGDDVEAQAPRFVTATGLCRWWDSSNV